MTPHPTRQCLPSLLPKLTSQPSLTMGPYLAAALLVASAAAFAPLALPPAPQRRATTALDDRRRPTTRTAAVVDSVAMLSAVNPKEFVFPVVVGLVLFDITLGLVTGNNLASAVGNLVKESIEGGGDNAPGGGGGAAEEPVEQTASATGQGFIDAQSEIARDMAKAALSAEERARSVDGRTRRLKGRIDVLADQFDATQREKKRR